jgi:addiction module RelB/DinJ family antitoxin
MNTPPVRSGWVAGMPAKELNMAAMQVTVQVDERTVNAAEAVFKHYGLDIPTVINILLTTAANEHRIPITTMQPDPSRPKVSLNGDEFTSDAEYFRQIPCFLDMLDNEAKSPERFCRADIGL